MTTAIHPSKALDKEAAQYTGVMEVMGKGGDVKVMWSKDNPAEVQAAREQFNSLRKQGFRAFVADAKGAQGGRLDEFDPAVERMVLVPQQQGG